MPEASEMVLITEPFGMSPGLTARKPWEAMKKRFPYISMRLLFGGAVYLAVGKSKNRPSKMGKAGMRAILLSWLVMAAAWFPQTSRSAPTDGHWDYMQTTTLKWLPYGPGALRKAAELKRPLFVLVYLDTCHWCWKYETETLETDRILKRLRTDYLPVAVNSALQPGLTNKLGASMVPTTILLTPEGRVMAKFKGFVDARDLADILDANLYRWRKGEIGGEEFGEPEVCCPLEAVPK